MKHPQITEDHAREIMKTIQHYFAPETCGEDAYFKCGIRELQAVGFIKKSPIDEVKEKIEYNKMLKETSRPLSSHAVLAEVRAVLEDIVEGEYRLFHSDSMDQDTGLEEDIRNLHKKVSEHFS